MALALVLLVGGCAEEKDDRAQSSERRLIHPVSGSALIEAEDAYNLGRYDRALALIDSAQAVSPNVPEAYFLRGLVYAALRKYESSQESYAEVLKRDDSYRGAHFNMANNYARVGDHGRAVPHYKAEAAMYPSAEVYVRLGHAYENDYQPDSARIAYEQAIELDSTAAAGYARLGQLLGTEGSYGEALECAREALRLDSSNVNYRYFLGYVLLQKGEPKAAVDYLRSVVEARPHHNGAHYSLGQALMQIGRDDEARRILARVDTLELRDRQIDKLQERADTYDNQPSAWVELAEALRKSDRTDEALDAYRVAAYLDPENKELLSNTATLALMNGDIQEAVGRYEAVLEMDSTLSNGWFNLGIAYLAAGKRESALRAWEQVLALEPAHPHARTYLTKYSDRSK